MDENIIMPKLEIKKWQTFDNWLWWKERCLYMVVFYICLVCLMQIMFDGLVIMISCCNSIQHFDIV
jgi:hypothetical protein